VYPTTQEEADRFGECPVCHRPRSREVVRRLIVHDDLEGWLCSTECERRWWGASDLIAVMQAEDAKLHARPPRRLGVPLLWEETHQSVSFDKEKPAWASSTAGRALDFRDSVLARMGGGRLRRLLRDWQDIRERPHRMLGGRPKELPQLSELEIEGSE
jgi:hypothetical protein